jgi:phosphoglycolate phosphatase-like HAD superfamily hydrolase
MQPLVLFDIDRTLFDTDKFHTLYISEFLPVLKNISVAEFETARKIYSSRLTVSTDFLPADYLKHLAEYFSVPYSQLRRKYYLENNFLSAVFPDVVPCLTQLSANYTLGIFSEGFPSFQTAKLKKSHLLHFFASEFTAIHRRKLNYKTLKKNPPGTFIIDDKPEVILAISTFSDLKLIGILLDRHSRFSSPHRITSLFQLPALLQQLSVPD